MITYFIKDTYTVCLFTIVKTFLVEYNNKKLCLDRWTEYFYLTFGGNSPVTEGTTLRQHGCI